MPRTTTPRRPEWAIISLLPRRLLAFALAVLTVAACGDDGDVVVAPTTTTTSAEQPEGCGTLADGAERVENAAAEVDLDDDGRPEDFYFSVADGDDIAAMVQVVRSSDGAVSDGVGLVGFVGLGGPLDHADVDGDGTAEVFFSLSGNTLLNGVVLDLEGCTLSVVTTAVTAYDDGDGVFTYPYASGGNGCAPSGCYDPVTCRSGPDGPEIVLTQIYPVTSALDPDFDPAALDVPAADQPVWFRQDVVRIVGGVAQLVEESEPTATVLGALDEWTAIDGVACSVGV